MSKQSTDPGILSTWLTGGAETSLQVLFSLPDRFGDEPSLLHQRGINCGSLVFQKWVRGCNGLGRDQGFYV